AAPPARGVGGLSPPPSATSTDAALLLHRDQAAVVKQAIETPAEKPASGSPPPRGAPGFGARLRPAPRHPRQRLPDPAGRAGLRRDRAHGRPATSPPGPRLPPLHPPARLVLRRGTRPPGLLIPPSADALVCVPSRRPGGATGPGRGSRTSGPRSGCSRGHRARH